MPYSKSEPPVGALAARAWGMEGTTLELNLLRVYSALPGAQFALPRLTEPAPCRSSESPGPLQSPTAASSYSTSFLPAHVAVTSPPGSFSPVLAAPSRPLCRGTSVPPASIKPSRAFADIPYGPSGGHLWPMCAEADAFQNKSPSSSSARTPLAASSPRKRTLSSSASTAPVFALATNSLPTKSSPCVSPIPAAKPTSASSAVLAKTPAVTSSASPSAIRTSISGRSNFLPRRSLSRVPPASISNVVFATNGSKSSRPKSNRTFFSLAKLSSVSVSPAAKRRPGKSPLERRLLRASNLHQLQPFLQNPFSLLTCSPPQCCLRPPLQYPPTPALPSLATNSFPAAAYCWLLRPPPSPSRNLQPLQAPLRSPNSPRAANSICVATSALASTSSPASGSIPPAKTSSSATTFPKAASVFAAAIVTKQTLPSKSPSPITPASPPSSSAPASSASKNFPASTSSDTASPTPESIWTAAARRRFCSVNRATRSRAVLPKPTAVIAKPFPFCANGFAICFSLSPASTDD